MSALTDCALIPPPGMRFFGNFMKESILLEIVLPRYLRNNPAGNPMDRKDAHGEAGWNIPGPEGVCLYGENL